jgi:ornithine--oxo-acid transaminase
MIADEVQTGIGRAGTLLACDDEGVRPDIVCLGKSLSGGMFPISITMGNADAMDAIKMNQHGSTFGGNPLAAAVVKASLGVVKNERLIENSFAMGQILREEVNKISGGPIMSIRGRGLMNALVIDESHGTSARQFCLEMAKQGVLTKPTHENIVRLTPPLCIQEDQVREAVDAMKRTLDTLGH